jgi:hypothetical protein
VGIVLDPEGARGVSPDGGMARVKVRISVRLKKLRLTVRGVMVRGCRTVQRHLRLLRRFLVQGLGETLVFFCFGFS